MFALYRDNDDLNRRSFFGFSSSGFFLCFLGSFVLCFLLGIFIFVDNFFISCFFGNHGFLSFLDFSDSFFSQSFFIFRFCGFDFSDGFKGDTFDGSFFFEGFLFFKFSLIGLFNFFMESSPGGGPSESLGFKFPGIEL